jgi:hypothetical protein
LFWRVQEGSKKRSRNCKPPGMWSWSGQLSIAFGKMTLWHSRYINCFFSFWSFGNSAWRKQFNVVNWAYSWFNIHTIWFSFLPYAFSSSLLSSFILLVLS